MTIISSSQLWWLVCESITLPIQAREYFFIWGVGKDLELLLKAEDIVTDIQDHWSRFDSSLSVNSIFPIPSYV